MIFIIIIIIIIIIITTMVGYVVECRSVTGELTVSCARPTAFNALNIFSFIYF